MQMGVNLCTDVITLNLEILLALFLAKAFVHGTLSNCTQNSKAYIRYIYYQEFIHVYQIITHKQTHTHRKIHTHKYTFTQVHEHKHTHTHTQIHASSNFILRFHSFSANLILLAIFFDYFSNVCFRTRKKKVICPMFLHFILLLS